MHAYIAAVVLGVIYATVFVPRVISPDNREGMRALVAGDYVRAHAAFVRSEQVWRRRPLTDRWHMPLLMYASPHSLVTMARNNQASALDRLGKIDESIALYEQVLVEDPQLTIAAESLDFLKSAREAVGAQG